MEKIVSDITLNKDELLNRCQKREIYYQIEEYYSKYPNVVINMHRGGHIIQFRYDDEHLLFNIQPYDDTIVAKIRLEPRVVKMIDINKLSEKGKLEYNQKKFCQTGYWIYLDLDNINDLVYLIDEKIKNLDRVSKKYKKTN